MAGFPNTTKPYGSQKTTIIPPANAPVGSPTGPYVVKNMKVPAYDAAVGTTADELNNEDGQWFMGKLVEGTATLQFPDINTPVPVQYSIMPVKRRGVTALERWIIYSAGETYEANGETVIDVKIRRDAETPSVPAGG